MFKVRTFSIGLMLSLVFVMLLTVSAASAQEETKLGGNVTVRDDGGNANSSLVIALTELPTPAAGQAYEGWLFAADGSKTSAGLLVVAVDGSVDQEYVDPDGSNLLAKYTTYAITSEPSPDPDTATAGEVLYADSIPEGAGAHAGSLLAGDLRSQVGAALAHAKLAEASATLASQQSHAQHVINVVEGAGGANFDASADNPGDGSGVFAHADDLVAHAESAKAAVPSTDTDVIAALDAAIANAKDARTGAEQARNNAVSLLLATASDTGTALQLQNMSIGLSNGNDSAELAYENAQDVALFVPVLGGTTPQPKPPAVGDEMVPLIAMAMLLMGLVASGAGGLLLVRQRRSATV